MFTMLIPRQWVGQNTSDTNPAYTWLNFEFSRSNKNVHILDGADKIFKKYKTEEEKWQLNNHQFPLFEQKLITVESVSNVCFENLCNRWVSQRELSDVSINHNLGESSVEMDTSNNSVLVNLEFDVFNSDNTIPFFRCKGKVKLEVKSMEKFILVTENNDTTNIEMDWTFYKSVVLKSAKAIEGKMRKQRLGTPFVNCSFEAAFDNERLIRAIKVWYL